MKIVDFKVDGKPINPDSFTLPVMSLSSSRSEMIKHEFELTIKAGELVNRMNADYNRWVMESREDDQQMGGPQDELAEADYPLLEELVKNPVLVELTFGHYLVREMFNKFLPNNASKTKYWYDRIESCSTDGGIVVFNGICYSK